MHSVLNIANEIVSIVATVGSADEQIAYAVLASEPENMEGKTLKPDARVVLSKEELATLRTTVLQGLKDRQVNSSDQLATYAKNAAEAAAYWPELTLGLTKAQPADGWPKGTNVRDLRRFAMTACKKQAKDGKKVTDSFVAKAITGKLAAKVEAKKANEKAREKYGHLAALVRAVDGAVETLNAKKFEGDIAPTIAQLQQMRTQLAAMAEAMPAEQDKPETVDLSKLSAAETRAMLERLLKEQAKA